MIKDLVRAELRDFIPYNPNQIPYRVKLDANESPFGLPENVKKKLADYFLGNPALYLYPDTDSLDLRKALAEYWKTDMNGIVVGTGSDQLIEVLIHTFVGKGDRVICPTPSFSMYKLTTLIASGVPVELKLNPGEDYRYDPDEVIRLANEEKAKLVFLCTPNNPTGDTIPMADIVKIIEGCPNSIIAIDEAYAEFSGETAIPLVSKYENIIIMRTFSKAYGLAGIRCGYSISSSELANELNKVRPPYNISSLSLLVAKLVFEEKGQIDKQVEYIVEQREYMAKSLSALNGVYIYPSKSNFLLMKIPKSDMVNKELVKRGVLVRNFGNAPMLENCLRISIGSQEQNDILLQELKAIL